MSYFPNVSLLDRDLVARRTIEIDRRKRRRYVEGDTVSLRKHCDHVCSDLVRDITVRGDPITADYDGLHAALLHDVAAHAVRDQCDRYVVLHKLPGS